MAIKKKAKVGKIKKTGKVITIDRRRAEMWESRVYNHAVSRNLYLHNDDEDGGIDQGLVIECGCHGFDTFGDAFAYYDPETYSSNGDLREIHEILLKLQDQAYEWGWIKAREKVKAPKLPDDYQPFSEAI